LEIAGVEEEQTEHVVPEGRPGVELDYLLCIREARWGIYFIFCNGNAEFGEEVTRV
jgi:hypothetical protein